MNQHHASQPRRATHSNRRAFATFSAVALLGTTAIALTTVAGVTVRQHQRTRDAAADAQLRQMLAAGQQFLPTTPADNVNGDDHPRPQLPEALGVGDATLQIGQHIQAGEPTRATLTVTLRGRTARMSLSYDADSQRWVVDEVELP